MLLHKGWCGSHYNERPKKFSESSSTYLGLCMIFLLVLEATLFPITPERTGEKNIFAINVVIKEEFLFVICFEL